MNTYKNGSRNILLAEDDEDDTMLFKEVLSELPLDADLSHVKDGEELMRLLANKPESKLPDLLFLDINMPRKNGFECLVEIKNNDRLKKLPVVILSTSSGKELVSKMYNAGANLYVCKPNQFAHLKKIVLMIMEMNLTHSRSQPPFEEFLLRI